ncbi:MAG: ATP-binding protein, partial [Candidatus Acidiferrales bacterium]
MKSTLRNRVIETIRRHKMIAAGDRIGVAVSAGADSVALWRLLEDFRGDLGASLCVLHLNHGLRGEASDADESFVADLARDTGVEFISRREDVAALAQRSHWNLEDAGRRIRYEFFANVVAQQKCAKVAVA